MRILGVDIGTSSIKAVEIDSTFGRFEIREYHEKVLAADSNPYEALSQLIASLPKKPDRIATAIRTSQSSFRNLQLPTKDRKTIQSTVSFELEDELPYTEDSLFFDFSIISQVGNSSKIHVATTLKPHIQNLISQFQSFQIEPDLITTEFWAIRTLISRMTTLSTLTKPIGVIVCGNNRSLFYAGNRNQPLSIREIPFGGADLTTAICRKYGIPIDQAETAKLTNGFVLAPSQRTSASQEQKDFSDQIALCLRDLVREVRQFSMGIRANTGEALDALYLTGGTSLLPGLGRFLSEELGIPVRPLLSLSGVSKSGLTFAEAVDAGFTLALGSALALTKGDKSSAIQLRRGEFAKKAEGGSFDFSHLKQPVLAFCIVYACFLLSQFYQNWEYDSRLKQTNAQLEKSVKTFFTGISAGATRTYLSKPQDLKKAIHRDLEKQRELARLLTQTNRTPLKYLKALSQAINKESSVDLVQFQLGSSPNQPYGSDDLGDLSMSFIVDSAAVADKISSILSSRIDGIQKSKPEELAELGSDGKSKRLKITFTGKPMESAYGN